MKAAAEVVIVSGGAETVSVALADTMNRSGRPYSVLSLNPGSLLDGLSGCQRCVSLWKKGDSFDDTRIRLIEAMQTLHAELGKRLLVFPTEDDGLSLLNASQSELSPICEFSRCRALSSGGLDKNELFEQLTRQGLGDLTPASYRLERIEELPDRLRQLGGRAIIKPAHKPWQRTIDPAGSKVFDSEHYLDLPDGENRLMEVLQQHWALASGWLVQEKLTPYEDGEHSSCVVRSDRFTGMQVVEQLQFPLHGGSAVIVKSTPDQSLLSISGRIAEALDLIGMAEMSFLLDQDNQAKLIELNTRPWLQIAVVEASGYPIVEETLRALEQQSTEKTPRELPRELPRETQPAIISRQWVHVEQLLRGCLSGGFGPRWQALRRILHTIESRPILAVYSARLRGVRWRWIKRNLRKLFGG